MATTAIWMGLFALIAYAITLEFPGPNNKKEVLNDIRVRPRLNKNVSTNNTYMRNIQQIGIDSRNQIFRDPRYMTWYNRLQNRIVFETKDELDPSKTAPLATTQTILGSTQGAPEGRRSKTQKHKNFIRGLVTDRRYKDPASHGNPTKTFQKQ